MTFTDRFQTVVSKIVILDLRYPLATYDLTRKGMATRLQKAIDVMKNKICFQILHHLNPKQYTKVSQQYQN